MPTPLKELIDRAATAIQTYDVPAALDRFRAGDALFIDVRDEPELRADGRIPGAHHASRGMLEFHIDPQSPYHQPVFDAGRELIFYCKSGGRSALAAQRAQEMGLGRVRSMSGGLLAWKAQGGPTEATV
jgi:rhodanese-related sulfurtransferase